MAFTFSQPLKLLAIGGSLITSTSIWFFNPHDPIQPQTRSSLDSSLKTVVRETNPNINLFSSAPKLEGLNGKVLKDDGIKDQSLVSNQDLYKFKLKSNEQEKILHFPTTDLDNLELGNVYGFKKDYEEFDKSSIQIKLFSKYAWHTTDGQEEFKAPLSNEEINELFGDLNEIKTKQLLLSLQKSRKWMVNGNVNTSSPTYYYADVRQPQHTYSLDGLKDLKIKYFTEFKDLKEYVHKKVKESCKDDALACIAHKDELNMLDMDWRNFFLNLKSSELTNPKSEVDANINSYDAEEKLSSRVGAVKKDSNIQNKNYNSPYFVFNLQGETTKRSLSTYNFQPLDHMNLKNVYGLKSLYTNLPKSSIKIQLFKNAAWYSKTGQEEYQDALAPEKIEELFKDLDETKTKQLLLSLQKRRKWMVMGSLTDSTVYYYNDIHQPENPQSIDDLKDLKIKYFSDFNSLNAYVQEKVTSCKDDTKSCVAHPDELDTMETDREEFFRQSQ